MGGLFGKNKAPGEGGSASSGQLGPSSAGAQVTSKDRAVLELKVARDKLKKYQKKVNFMSLYYDLL